MTRTLFRLATLSAALFMVVLAASMALAQTQSPYQSSILRALENAEQGDFRAAATAAGTAFRLANTGDEKRRAARLAAGAEFQAGRFIRAEWWLRRASNYSRTADDRASIAQDFRRVRDRNPFSARLSFSISPSDNVNGGAESPLFFLDDFAFILAPRSVALSGLEYSGDVELSYRISQNERQTTSLGLYGYARTFTLSSSPRASAPGVSGGDYALSLLEASINHRRLIFRNLGLSNASLRIGRVWYGGDPVWDYARLALSQDIRLNQNASANVEIAVERQRSLDGIQPDATIYDLTLGYARRLQNADIVRVSLSSRWNDASIPTYAYDDHRLTIGYQLGRPVLGTRLSGSLAVGRKSYDVFSLSLNGRRDNYVRASLSAVFEDISYYGFSPSLTLVATRTESNVARFTTRSAQIRLGLQSSF